MVAFTRRRAPLKSVSFRKYGKANPHRVSFDGNIWPMMARPLVACWNGRNELIADFGVFDII